MARCQPDVSFPIFKQGIDNISGEPLFRSELFSFRAKIGNPKPSDSAWGSNTAETIYARTDPKTSIPIEEHPAGVDSNLRHPTSNTEAPHGISRSPEHRSHNL